VTVSRDLLSFRRGDAARSEFVESDLGGKELLNSIGHTEGVSKPTNTGRALGTRFVGGAAHETAGKRARPHIIRTLRRGCRALPYR